MQHVTSHNWTHNMLQVAKCAARHTLNVAAVQAHWCSVAQLTQQLGCGMYAVGAAYPSKVATLMKCWMWLLMPVAAVV